MRDPDGKLETYKEEMELYIYVLNHISKDENPDAIKRWKNGSRVLPYVIKCMLCRYGSGDPLADIWSYFEKDGWPFYQRAVAIVKQLPPQSLDEGQRGTPIGLATEESAALEVHFFLALLIFMDQSPERLMNHRNW